MGVLTNHTEAGFILMMNFVEFIQKFHFMKEKVNEPINEIIDKHDADDSL